MKKIKLKTHENPCDFILRPCVDKGFIYLGRRDGSVGSLLFPHRYGLHLMVEERPKQYRRYTIPGEIALNKVVYFIANKANKYGYTYERADRIKIPDKVVPQSTVDISLEVDIRKALVSSGIWEKRGMMDPKKLIPKAFFTSYPMADLCLGRHCSLKAWWIDYLVRNAPIDYQVKGIDDLERTSYHLPDGQIIHSDDRYEWPSNDITATVMRHHRRILVMHKRKQVKMMIKEGYYPSIPMEAVRT